MKETDEAKIKAFLISPGATQCPPVGSTELAAYEIAKVREEMESRVKGWMFLNVKKRGRKPKLTKEERNKKRREYQREYKRRKRAKG